jgi:tRNA-splicing ligase RtcB (3'-phosphate/5'-hydroxy nucleic acid ligase)
MQKLMSRKPDYFEQRARELCREAGIDPDSRIGEGRGRPAWCDFREAARLESQRLKQEALSKHIATMRPQEPKYQSSPWLTMGQHDQATLDQMTNCMKVGNAVGGVICADGHLGYAQPVGGVIAYEDQISISGVGFDIACGNMAAKLNVKLPFIDPLFYHPLAQDIANNISFGVGRTNEEKVEHELFDDNDAWRDADMEDYKAKAQKQLGTVGSGNHYVDLFYDEESYIWIGVHFGSRGLGHTSATRYLKLAGGTDGMHVPPAMVDVESELGARYLAAMRLAGRYAYAGREWVVEKVRQIIGATITETVHNHHNYAWLEEHGGRGLWVVRKGATPAWPGQKGFVGGSMGDCAVIIEGVDSYLSKEAFYSTIHGAGRLFGRKQAIRTFKREQMDDWLTREGVTLIGGDLDESPMAYRRLPEVLKHHEDTIKILHTLKPFVVVMAGNREQDPWKD